MITASLKSIVEARDVVGLPCAVAHPRKPFGNFIDTRKRYRSIRGNLFSEMPGRHFEAIIDGENVTQRCFYCCPRTGEVGLYRLNESGRIHHDPANPRIPAVEYRTGKVELVYGLYAVHKGLRLDLNPEHFNFAKKPERIRR